MQSATYWMCGLVGETDFQAVMGHAIPDDGNDLSIGGHFCFDLPYGYQLSVGAKECRTFIMVTSPKGSMSSLLTKGIRCNDAVITLNINRGDDRATARTLCVILIAALMRFREHDMMPEEIASIKCHMYTDMDTARCIFGVDRVHTAHVARDNIVDKLKRVMDENESDLDRSGARKGYSFEVPMSTDILPSHTAVCRVQCMDKNMHAECGCCPTRRMVMIDTSSQRILVDAALNGDDSECIITTLDTQTSSVAVKSWLNVALDTVSAFYKTSVKHMPTSCISTKVTLSSMVMMRALE